MPFTTASLYVSTIYLNINLTLNLSFLISYFIILAFESAALAEKLLNDMLKATEAFNKVKKLSDGLKA